LHLVEVRSRKRVSRAAVG